LPALIALLGWIFVFLTSGKQPILYSLLALVIGVFAFLLWSKLRKSWPFSDSTALSNLNADISK
jgi:hypothetical protein